MKLRCVCGFLFFHMVFSFLYAGDFSRVHSGSSEYEFVEKVFKVVLEPLYGDQSRSLAKIAEGKDRVCELFCDGGDPLGILVYKTDLVQEFSEMGVNDVLEIKTLFVIDAEKNSGKRVGSFLMERIVDAAKIRSAKNIVVTVSESKPDSLQFFFKKGFKVVHTFHGKYIPGIDEYLLARPA